MTDIQELYRQRDELNQLIEEAELGSIAKLKVGDKVSVRGVIEEIDLSDNTVKVLFYGENTSDYCWVSLERITKIKEE